MDDSPLDLSGSRILVVDDVPANVDVLRQALEAAAYQVMVASSGEVALDLAMRFLPDLILLDVMMPGLDGFATCRRLKQGEGTRSIPVIFVTARDDNTGLVEGFRAGAVDYIAKPFHQEEVLVRIQTHLEKARLLRQLQEQNRALSEEITQRQRLASERATACDAELTKVAAQAKANDDQLARMQSNLSATKDELPALRTQRIETENRMAAIADIQGQFAKMIDTGQLKVAARRGSLVVELPAEVLFPSGSAELSEKGQIAVIEVGVVLKQFPDRRFLVVGHTDNAPLKNSVYQDNWELSTARALTVTRFLAKAGMKADSLVAAGVGEHDPLSGNASAGDRQRNRRIEIQLLPAITELPPLPATLGEAGAAPVPAPP